MPKRWVFSLSLSFLLEFWVFFSLSFFSNVQRKSLPYISLPFFFSTQTCTWHLREHWFSTQYPSSLGGEGAGLPKCLLTWLWLTCSLKCPNDCLWLILTIGNFQFTFVIVCYAIWATSRSIDFWATIRTGFLWGFIASSWGFEKGERFIWSVRKTWVSYWVSNFWGIVGTINWKKA